MADRPILFSGPMVRALLEGRKTQTRRVVKPQPEADASWAGGYRWTRKPATTTRPVAELHALTAIPLVCPYGSPGDLLWVRETCCPDWADKPVYKADGGSAREAGYPAEPRWRPSIHMPRWSSRLTLRITDVRVERLTAISDDDIWAEGVQVPPPCSGPIVRSAFAVLWDSINGAGSFDANPWVWALTFEVIPRNINDVLLELANAPEPAR